MDNKDYCTIVINNEDEGRTEHVQCYCINTSIITVSKTL